MKVKQFLNKFLYASSSIKFVYLADQVGMSFFYKQIFWQTQ